MTPTTLIAIITVGISIWAFKDQQILSKFILSPYAVVHQKQWYRLITHAFIHADWMHLLFNMLALWSFGEALGYYFSMIGLSSIHIYILYFGAVLFSSVPDIIKHKNDYNYLSLGASGGVSAIIFAAILFNPWSLIYIWFIPCPGIIFAVLYLIYCSYQNKKGNGEDRINHSAHLYGAIFGIVYPILAEPQILKIFIEQLKHPSFL